MNWRLKIVLTAVFSLVVTSTQAQDLGALEVGTSINYTSPSGDLDIDANPQVNGEWFLRYNFPYRISLRASVAQNFKYTTADDAWDLYASSKAALGLEYHFKDINIYNHRSQFSPYMMIGFSYQFNYRYSEDIQVKKDIWDQLLDSNFTKYTLGDDEIDATGGFVEIETGDGTIVTVEEQVMRFYQKGLSDVLRDGGLKQLGIIVSFGVKYKVASFLIISAELSAVYLGSDEYDRERLQQSEDLSGSDLTFNNKSGNDWYLNPNLTITIPLITFAPKF